MAGVTTNTSVHTEGEAIKVAVADNMDGSKGSRYTIITLRIGGNEVQLFGKEGMLDDFKQAVADAYEKLRYEELRKAAAAEPDEPSAAGSDMAP